jgi:hypothetical protein
MNRILLLTVFLLSGGCASIDYQTGPVPGLEHMTVDERVVDASAIYQACSRCGHRGLVLPIACTCIDFSAKRAVIWLPRDASQPVIEHERAHARGYDHPDGELRDRYQTWLASRPRQASLPPRLIQASEGVERAALGTTN